MPRNSDDRQRRRSAERAGRVSEYIAAGWLLLRGFWPIAMRVRTPRGEIDLIVRRGQLVVFVEVKSRRSHSEAAHAVTPVQQRRIVGAAEAWLAMRPEFVACAQRFDCVLLHRGGLPVHVPDAFTA